MQLVYCRVFFMPRIHPTTAENISQYSKNCLGAFIPRQFERRIICFKYFFCLLKAGHSQHIVFFYLLSLGFRLHIRTLMLRRNNVFCQFNCNFFGSIVKIRKFTEWNDIFPNDIAFQYARHRPIENHLHKVCILLS